MSLFIEFMDKFNDNPDFNFIIDPHLTSLIQKGLNLAEYFESKMPIQQISKKDFPNLHSDSKELIKPADYPSIKEALDNYDEVLGKHLHEYDSEQMNPIEYYLINIPDTLTA